jgi:hypothetical protein
MKKCVFLVLGLAAAFCLFCGTADKKEGSRFNRLDETSPEYSAKAEAYMAEYFNMQKIPVDSIKVDGPNLRIKFNSDLPDSFYRAYAGMGAMEYYKFKKKTALMQNMPVHVFCAAKRGLVAQAVYP